MNKPTRAPTGQFGRRVKALDAEIIRATRELADSPALEAGVMDKKADNLAALIARRDALQDVYLIALRRASSAARINTAPVSIGVS